MIDWKTILSTFDDEPTLMEWLNKVEEALKADGLQSVTTQSSADGLSTKFIFNFADGSTVETDYIRTKGDKGDKGDSVSNKMYYKKIKLEYNSGYMHFGYYSSNNEAKFDYVNTDMPVFFGGYYISKSYVKYPIIFIESSRLSESTLLTFYYLSSGSITSAQTRSSSNVEVEVFEV